MINKFSLLLLLTLIASISNTFAQEDGYPRNWDIDILHYRFELELSDQDNLIKGETTIDFQLLKAQEELVIDLVKEEGERGMTVNSIKSKGQPVEFYHEGDQITIDIKDFSLKEKHQVVIEYQGIPKDGLVISENKFGDRTFFGDNWPNRAHNWLACVDHPSEKASVEFLVTAPSHYQVVATGLLKEQTDLEDNKRLTHYGTEIDMSPKVMVIGVGRFAIQTAGHLGCTQVSSWVYPQNREKGFHDYEQAVEVLDWFINKIGEYPYEKLANVQSKTRFGGMENAGNIFYFEGSVTGERAHEDLLAHEIAHQWFGNSATEKQWHHIWLSEGFATYFADVYIEEKYGEEKRQERMLDERRQVVEFYKRQQWPVVYAGVSSLMDLLNDNSYEKGAWILHMLRRKIGDEKFFQGITNYYNKFRDSVALSEEFQAVMEEASGEDLNAFFQQWLYRAGHPQLKTEVKNIKGKTLIELIQTQEKPFNFEVELEAVLKDGSIIELGTHSISESKQLIETDIKDEIERIIIDPDVHLLFELTK